MIKKIFLLLLLLILPLLSGCSTNFFNEIEEDDEDEEYIEDPELPNIYTESNYYHYLDISSVGDLKDYFTIFDVKDGDIPVTSDMISGKIYRGTNKITLTVTDSDNNTNSKTITINVGEYSPYVSSEDTLSKIDPNVMPTSGRVRVLVIPINLDPNKPATEDMRKNIYKAFFGTEQDTGWESLSTYYNKSSNGKLIISGAVTDWFTPSKEASYYVNYEDNDDYYYGSTMLLNEALNCLSYKYSFSEYDSNRDGYIDAVYLIYNNDIGGNGTQSNEDFFWAYTTFDFNADKRPYSSTKGYGYVFMGYDFLEQKFTYSNKKVTLNCETIIHETGHLMNLEDYYDYDVTDIYRNDGGYCGCDMMELNIGDHGPLSKLLLDWVDPVVIDRSGIYELPAFTTTGITFLIPASGEFKSLFSEYYLIDFYTFDGLNALEVPSYFETGKDYAGVRVSHVDTTLVRESGYYPYFKYNNTDSKHKLIRLLEADYDGIFDIGSPFTLKTSLSDFYTTGKSMPSAYKNYKSHNGENIPFNLEVISIKNGIATVKIKLK